MFIGNALILFPGWQKGQSKETKRNRTMISKRNTAALATATLLLGFATQAFADHDKPGRNGPIYDFADVISSKPIVRYVTVTTPVKECWDEVEYYTVNERPRGVGGRTLFGAIIGGVVGHQFGSGRGNDAATVAGSLIGASIGHQSAYSRHPGKYGPVQYSRPVKRCETQYREHQEKRVDGYDVLYRYNGQRYATRMASDPGRKIRVRVDVRPVA
jgi:uncharacterized protein YcfJ